jgi:hypothetical protein
MTERVTEHITVHADSHDSTQVSRSSGVTYRIGGGSFAMFTAPQCFVCNCDWRVDIETQVCRGYSYSAIASKLPEMMIFGEMRRISARNIREHVQNEHLPLEKTAQRAALDERVIELGQALDEAEGSVVDHVAFLRDLTRRGYEAMSDGRLGFNVRDVIRASVALAKIDADAVESGTLSIEDTSQAFAEYGSMALEVFRRMEAGEIETADEASRAMGRAIQQNAALKALGERVRAKQAEQAALPSGQ